MEALDQFKSVLLTMLQSGAYREWLGCDEGQCVHVEFRQLRVYRIRVGAQHIVFQEQDVETVRRLDGGRWKPVQPDTCQEMSRVIIDRATGRILDTPHQGQHHAGGVMNSGTSHKKNGHKKNGAVLYARR